MNSKEKGDLLENRCLILICTVICVHQCGELVQTLGEMEREGTSYLLLNLIICFSEKCDTEVLCLLNLFFCVFLRILYNILLLYYVFLKYDYKFLLFVFHVKR